MTAERHASKIASLVEDLATERDIEKKNAEQEADMERPDCLCADHFPSLRKADHDQLLAADCDGPAGLVLFIEDIVARTVNYRDPGQLHYWELREFVNVHNWQDPVAMFRLASLLDTYIIEPERKDQQEARAVAARQSGKGAA